MEATMDRLPLEEIAKRAAEAGAGLAAAAKAVGMEDHRRALRDHNRRIRDDHEWAKQLRGQVTDAQQDDDMGDIIVTGDLYGDAAVQALDRRKQRASEPSPPVSQPAATVASPKRNWLLPLALAGAFGTGAAMPMALNVLRSDAQQPAAEQPVEMPKYDVEKWIPDRAPTLPLPISKRPER